MDRCQIRVISVPAGTSIKVSVYADYRVFFCKDEYNLDFGLKLFEKVQRSTGSLNQSKTSVLRLGHSCTRQCLTEYIKDEVKICGVCFSCKGYDHTARRNADARQSVAVRKVDKLSRLSITVHVKVILINSIVHSQFFF